MMKYIVLAVLIALGVLLYVKREEVMNFFRGEQSPTEQMAEAMGDLKARAQAAKDAMMGDDEEVEVDEVEVSE